MNYITRYLVCSVVCMVAAVTAHKQQCFRGSGTLTMKHEGFDDQQIAIETYAISHPVICNATRMSCPSEKPNLIWSALQSYDQDHYLSLVDKELLACVAQYGIRFYIQEYRERCFQGYGTHTMQIRVNTSYDALSKINTAMSAITNPKIGNATEVTCPGLTYWRTLLSGDVTSIYIAGNEAMNPNQADKDLLARIKPFLYNNFSVNLSNLPWWGIFLIVIGCLLCLCGCFALYACWDDIKRKFQYLSL